MTVPLQTKIEQRVASIGIIGLGYVGLTTMQAFAIKGFRSIGYDRNKHKVQAHLSGTSPIKGIDASPLLSLIKKKKCCVKDESEELKGCDVFIIFTKNTCRPAKGRGF